jgi:hypothetical protein
MELLPDGYRPMPRSLDGHFPQLGSQTDACHILVEIILW